MNNESLKYEFLKRPIANIDKIIMKIFRHGYNEAIHDFYELSTEMLQDKDNKRMKKEDIEQILLSVFDECINKNKQYMNEIDKN